MNIHPSEQVERLRDLLQEVLAPICTSRKLDQLAKLDVDAVAGDAWQNFLIENPELEADSWWCSPQVTSALDDVIVWSLGENAGEELASASTSVAAEPAIDTGVLTKSAMETLLGTWLNFWHRQLCAIDPLAAEIVLLRMRGFGNRAISEGLETGLRLVNRIVADIHAERSEVSDARGKEVA